MNGTVHACVFEGVLGTREFRAEGERKGSKREVDGGARKTTTVRETREKEDEKDEKQKEEEMVEVDERAADASVRLRVELDNTRGLERLVPTP